MSNKKLVYFLIVSLVYGLIAGGLAHGQSATSLTFTGTVTDAAGEPAGGYEMEATVVPVNPLFIATESHSGSDGTYTLALISFLGGQLSAGDEIKISAKDSGDNVVGAAKYIITADAIAALQAIVDISLSGLSAELEKNEVPADGVSTSKITVTVNEAGSPVTGDTVTISADQGTVSDVTNNGDGTYTATYTAPSLALTASMDDEISVGSAQLNQERTTSIRLIIVPTVITVAVAPNTFTADTPGTGAVTITVKRGADLISDEMVELDLSRSDGKPDAGAVSDVTNNGDGTYTATYTSGGTVGSITLTATANQADASEMAAITVNAGPPAEIALRASPDTISSNGSSIITATVTDSAGNSVGGLILAGTTSSGGTLLFLADATQFGVYGATYTAPVVEAEETETIMVTVDGISEDVTLNLSPIPPKAVSIIVVEGVSYKKGREVSAGGLDVTVTIGDNSPQMGTTGEDGTFSATVVKPGGTAARTGDVVTIVVTDDTGEERGSREVVLTNEHLEDDDNPNDARVQLDVETDITSTSVSLVVAGTVFLEDGMTAATRELREGGLTVVVTNTARNVAGTGTVRDNGGYTVTLFNLGNTVAETGDELTVEVQNDAGDTIKMTTHPLTTAEVEAGQAQDNVTTDLIATSASLAVTGTVYLEDGMTEATGALREGGLTVVVTNTARNVAGTGTVRDDGGYAVTLFNLGNTVAETDDELTFDVKVQNGAGDTVGTATRTLTTAEVVAGKVNVPVITDLIATSASLAVTGTVYLEDGITEATSALRESDLTVVVTNTARNVERTGTVRDDGKYTVTLFNLGDIVAGTGDELTFDVKVQNGAGDTVGTATRTLTTAQVVAGQIPVNVKTDLIATSASLAVTGTVYLEDGITEATSALRESDLTVVVTNPTRNVEETGTVRDDGKYTVTLFNLGNTVAGTGDALTIEVQNDAGDTIKMTTRTLTTVEVVAGQIPVNVKTDLIATSASLAVSGTVFLKDGMTVATRELREGGLTVVVTNPTRNVEETGTVRDDGKYTVTLFNLGDTVAGTGDELTFDVKVQNGAGDTVGTATRTLTTAQVVAGQIPVNVITTLIATSASFAVSGTVYLEDGTTVATRELRNGGLTVVVTNNRNNLPGSGVVRDDGGYTATLFNLGDTVVQTGDDLTVNVEVRNGAGDTVGTTTRTLTTAEVVAKRAQQVNVDTDLVAASATLAVTGTIYLKNGDGEPIPAMSHLTDSPLTVVVTNTNLNIEGMRTLRDNGEYTVTLFSPPPDVIETFHELTIEVKNEAGDVVGPLTSYTLTTANVAVKRVHNINVPTDLLAKITSLLILGSVIELDGTPAGAGLEVAITLMMNGETRMQEVNTDSAGNYRKTFFETDPVVATGDRLMVDVSRADGFHGHAEINPLRSSQIVYQNQPLTVDPIKMLPPIKELGGLSISSQAAEGIISREAIQTNPALLEMIPSGILHLDLLQGLLSNLPDGFDPTNGAISRENFGNAITPKPAWHVLAEGMMPDSGRWLNGDLLNLYVRTGPTAARVMFTLSGTQSRTVGAERIAVGGAVPYTFQLEEERAVLFLPSWPGLNEDMSAFTSVDLMIDGHASSISMAQNMAGVWEAEAQLTPGSKVSYYYQVTLAQSYQVGDETVSDWAMPDPRNLQVEDRGIVDTLLAPDGPDLIAIVTAMDLKLRSIFAVPAVDNIQSLWVYPFDLSDVPDGMYQLDTVIAHADTVITNNSDYVDYVEEIDSQMFMLDRRAPTADLTLDIGENSGRYWSPEANSYVAAAHSEAATLTVTAKPTGDPMDPGAYLYQIISLDAAGNPGVQVWNPAPVTTDLPLTYMAPHQVTLPIGGENSLMGHFGLRAAGIDSILNISSSTMPTMLEVVPPDPDIAAVRLVHADYNADGVFESVQRVSGGVTIFSNASTVRLTVEMTRRTKHPLKSIAVDFLNGRRGWQRIAFLTRNGLAAAESRRPFNVNWQRAGGFTDLRQATVRVTVINALDVSAESTATFKFVPSTLKLGGLSINPHYAADGLISLDAIQTNPDLLQLLPSGLLHADLLQGLLSSLPADFDPTNRDIDRENFGNALTPRPAWHVLAENSLPDPGRWLNGDTLNLYVVAGPVPESVRFSLTGPQSGLVEAVSVPAAGTFKHTFQLEEERAVLLLPSWPGLNENMPVFLGVTLMIDRHAPMPMVSKSVGDAVVWETEAPLRPGSKVAYYYQVELAQPYELEGVTLSGWPMPDPRNLQLEDRGIVETLRAPELVPELKAILTTMDLKLRSVFTVPVVNNVQSLWVGKFDFAPDADGAYSLDTIVQYGGGLVRSIPNQMFTLDRTPPTADIMVDIGEDSGVYPRDDGSYVAAAHTDAGTLTLAAMPMGAPSEPDAYLYQMIPLTDGDSGDQVWQPVMTDLPLTYMMPHQVGIPVGDLGQYGVRAVGIDSILNISSSTMPTMLEVVPPDPDNAALTLVHADYDGDGTMAGRFESVQHVSDGVTIFSDRSTVTLTLEITERTKHPLKSIAVDFQINGEGNWKPIKHFNADELANLELDKGSELTAIWDRTEDFAGILDIRGRAMVRVTVANALDVVSDDSIAMLELIPPALRLGGLSINPYITLRNLTGLGNAPNVGNLMRAASI